jgi:hypothetical protein
MLGEKTGGMFWHLHASVWGIRRKALTALLCELEASGRYIAIAEGFKGAHAKRIKQGDFPKVVGYKVAELGVPAVPTTGEGTPCLGFGTEMVRNAFAP